VKRILSRLLLAGMVLVPARLRGDDDPTMTYSVSEQSFPVQNIIVRAVTQNPADEPELENQFVKQFAKREIDAGTFSEVFYTTAAPAQMIQTMKQQGFNFFMCVWRRKVVQWDPSVMATPDNSLPAFLAKNLWTPASQNTQGYDPHQRGIDPTIEEALPGNDPIPGDAGGNTLDINRFNVVLYDLSTGQRLWRGIVQVRSSPDLRTSVFYWELVKKSMAYMAGAGLIPG
jgi:hypothetical protein